MGRATLWRAMWYQATRRKVLRGIAALAGGAALGPRVVGAETVEGRFVVDTAGVDVSRMRRREDITIVHDLDEEIGYVVCRGSERAIQSLGRDVDFQPDLRIELDLPREKAGPTTDAVDGDAGADEPAFFGLQWDKHEQEIGAVHEEATGDGSRIGVIDTGVLGASEQFDASHPDLDNVNKRLSTSFVPPPENGGDKFGAGPLAIDHGTHVAGIAAASGAGGGVIGMAPDAEIVDIRVFSGLTATFGDIVEAVRYGADVDCDVLNLSLGSGPLLPVDREADEITEADDPDGDGPIVPVPADLLAFFVSFLGEAGDYAVEHGALPVAAAGNDGVDLDRIFDEAFTGEINGVTFDGSAVSLPNEASGFMSVAAAGPIGWGWPGGGDDVNGLPIEANIDPELRTEEPAFFTNYGPDAVDVSAAGGNADIDPIRQEAGVAWFYDLVFNTTFRLPNGNVPPDTQLGDNYPPSYGWKAGTSMATPTTAGLVLLLAEQDPDATPEDIRARIETTASQVEVGLVADEDTEDDANGETTAPAQGISIDAVLDSGENVALDGVYNGDVASNPDSVDLDDPAYDSANFRGEGHLDALAAVIGFGD